MNILKPAKLKCIVFNQLRHTWTFLLFLCDLLAKIYGTAQPTDHQEQLANQNNNNNNNNNDLIMDQDMPEEEVAQPEEGVVEQLAHGELAIPLLGQPDLIALFQDNQGAGEPMDAASDLDEEEEEDDVDDVDVDYGDTDSESEFEEMFSDESTSSSDELDENRTVLNVSLSPEGTGKPALYSFQPLRLVKCPYKDKHIAGEFPLARSGHRIIASNSHLYSLGGYNPRSALAASRHGRCLLFQELWSYNFATRTWKLELNADNASNMPVELASNALTIHNNVLIVSIYLMLYKSL